MRQFPALTLCLALALVAGCDKKSDGGGTSSPPAPPVSSPPAGPGDAGPIDPAKTGSISGVVKLEGWLKPDVPVGGVNGIPYCAAQHPNGPPMGETLVMGDGQTMANVLVYVKGGLGRRSFPAAKEMVVFDQVACLYKPHVHAIRANQPLTIRNGDNTMHNVNGKPAFNSAFNRGQMSKGAEDTFQFPNPEIGINVKCDVHPWMSAWLHVVDHPFFQLTGKDGAYKLEGLPEGEYEVQAWHERFAKAPLVAMVKVKAKESSTQNFEFKGGEKPNK